MPQHPITDEEKAYWKDIRKQFYLTEGVTHMDGGAIGPSARPPFEKLIDLMRELEAHPLKVEAQIEHGEMEETREKIGAFTGADPGRLAFVQNSTMGMNIPAQGLPFEAGTEIVMTNQEYPAVRMLWRYIAERDNLVLREIPLPMPPESGQDIIDAYAEQVNDNTSVMIYSHVYCTTGLITDVTALSELARRHGAIAIADGAHAVGVIPVSIEDVGCDFYISSCHKWLLAPKGTGFVYIAPHLQNKVLPLIKGYSLAPSDTAARYDMTGTRDMTFFAGLGFALDYQLDIGWENRIRPYCLKLAAYVRKRALALPGVRLLAPDDPELNGFLTTFTIDGTDMEALARILYDQYAIQVQSPDCGGIRALRVTTHFYSSFEDIDYLMDTTETILAGEQATQK